MVDRDGDAANNGTGFGKPAKDLSINYVPVPYPDYPPGVISMRPGEHQLWRVLNASALTYLNLAVLYNRSPQPLGIVAMDGVPIDENGRGDSVIWQTHLGIPPGARVEFIVKGPLEGQAGLLVTRTVDTGPGGENDPNRALATIVASPDAPEPQSRLPQSTTPPKPAIRSPGWEMSRQCACAIFTSPKSWQTQMTRPAPSSSISPSTARLQRCLT